MREIVKLGMLDAPWGIESRGGQKIGMMDVPGRRKMCLCVYDHHRNVWTKVATFNNDSMAEYCMDFLAEFVGAKEKYDEVN